VLGWATIGLQKFTLMAVNFKYHQQSHSDRKGMCRCTTYKGKVSFEFNSCLKKWMINKWETNKLGFGIICVKFYQHKKKLCARARNSGACNKLNYPEGETASLPDIATPPLHEKSALKSKQLLRNKITNLKLKIVFSPSLKHHHLKKKSTIKSFQTPILTYYKKKKT
jgi:hypothetical protein